MPNEKPKHTKGPWLVRVEGLYLRIVHGEHRTTVADGIVSEANASLIAAAPDLYAACKWAESALAPFSKEPAEKSGMALLRTALAKARGGAPTA